MRKILAAAFIAAGLAVPAVAAVTAAAAPASAAVIIVAPQMYHDG